MEDEKIRAVIDGQEIECEVYFSFICNEKNKAYIGYTDHSVDENGKERVYVSSFDPTSTEKKLEDIKTDAEWDLINTMIDKIKNIG